jgi:phosphate starvation-inducible membrane PsiE
MEENALMMFIHSVFIALILFVLIFYVLQTNYEVALTWSVLIGAISLVYMVIFGHNLPSTNINNNLM